MSHCWTQRKSESRYSLFEYSTQQVLDVRSACVNNPLNVLPRKTASLPVYSSSQPAARPAPGRHAGQSPSEWVLPDFQFVGIHSQVFQYEWRFSTPAYPILSD